MVEKRIKVVPMMRGTAWDEKTEYKLVDYIVTGGSVMYMCRKVDNATGVCVGHPLTDTEWWDKCIDLSDVMSKAEQATTEAQQSAEEATRATSDANTATNTAKTAATLAQTATQAANAATTKANAAATEAQQKATEASKVNAVVEDDVLTVTDREGTRKEVSLVTQRKAEEIAVDTERMKKSLGVYSDRPDIVLTAKQTNVAISKDGVKVAKQGWAIAEFTAELGNEYLFKPGVTDGDVCVFAEYIDKVETRAIDYQTTYDESGRVKTATATYNGKTYTYTYDYSGTTTVITDQDGQKVQELPGVYTTTVGSYSVLTRLNEGAELPEDGYCRFVSNFQAAAAIKVVVSYKVGSADLTMKVVRDGMVASMCTQLSKINKKVDDVAQSVPKMWINVCSTKDTALMVDGKRVEIPAHRTVIFKEPLSVTLAQNTPNPNSFTRFDIHYGSPQPWRMRRLVLGMYYKPTDGATYTLYGMGCITNLDLSGMSLDDMKNMAGMFSSMSSLKYIAVDGLNVGNVTNMNNNDYEWYGLFVNDTSLKRLDLSGWDMSKISNLCNMFVRCTSLNNLNVENWNTSNAVNMVRVFYECNSLDSLDVSSFDLSKVKKIEGMFCRCLSLATLTFGEGFGKMKDECGTLDLSDLVAWKNDSVKSLLTLYDRKANGMGVITIKLHANAKAVLGEEGIAELTAKGYTIA